MMRVLTYNILAYQHADGPRRTAVIRAELARLRPDVVTLQEVTRTSAFDQARELLGAGYTLVEHPVKRSESPASRLADSGSMRVVSRRPFSQCAG